MRTRVLATIVAVMVSFVAFSQQRSVASVLKKLNPSQFSDTILNQSKINEAFFYTNHCLNKFRKENMIAFTSTVVGLGCIAFGSINSLNGIDKSNEYWELKVVAGGTFDRINANAAWRKEIHDIERRNKGRNYVGVAFLIGGSMLHVASYRWLKRAYVYPTKNGALVGVKINF